MKLQPVLDDLFEFLMSRVSGANFERFAKQVFAAQFGESFAPLGGMHDGGADGVLSSYIQEVEGKPNTFAQFSITSESDAKAKIRETIAALRKAGREPTQLIYATNQKLPKFDVIVAEVFDKDQVLVHVRDLGRLES